MDNRQHATFGDLINEVHRLCQEKATGTLFITGDNNRLAQISLKEGKFVLLSCLNKHGMEAVPLIRQISGGWFQFVKVKVSDDFSLPATADILSALGGGVIPPTIVAAAPVMLSKQMVATLQDTLAEYVGPVALLLCTSRLQGVSDVESALDILAREITNPQRAQQFKEKVRQRL
jgi:hypothetical protein